MTVLPAGFLQMLDRRLLTAYFRQQKQLGSPDFFLNRELIDIFESAVRKGNLEERIDEKNLPDPR